MNNYLVRYTKEKENKEIRINARDFQEAYFGFLQYFKTQINLGYVRIVDITFIDSIELIYGSDNAPKELVRTSTY